LGCTNGTGKTIGKEVSLMELSDFFGPLLLSLIRYSIILLVSYCLSFVTLPFLLGMITEAGVLKPNYQGEEIPVIGGLIFVTLLPFITAVGLFLGMKSFNTINSFLFLFVIFGMGFLGLVDDQFGNHSVKGFKGHFTKLFKEKKLTTGGFKAVFGSIVALAFSIGSAKFIHNNWWFVTLSLDFLLIVLSANSINLFDLRPGRAGKIYIFGFIIVLIFSKDFENYIGLFLPILAIMFAYLPLDLRAKVMMGDLGSNVLGASLGIMMSWMFTDISKIVAIVILILIQLAAEKYSFSEIINNYHILRSIDELGRRKNH
jgi:UDP-N-acetylmuramyl pentapeptide phosphotransferase/UDP-N-acetylglucosamine-1-phosphate transferase